MSVINRAGFLLVVCSLFVGCSTNTSRQVNIQSVSIHSPINLPEKSYWWYIPGINDRKIKPKVIDSIQPYKTGVERFFTNALESAIHNDGKYSVVEPSFADANIQIHISRFDFVRDASWVGGDEVVLSVIGKIIVTNSEGKRIWHDRFTSGYGLHDLKRFPLSRLQNFSSEMKQALEQGARVAMENVIREIELNPKHFIGLPY